MKRSIDPTLSAMLMEIHSELPVITEDEFKTLIPMIVSPDIETRDLAVNILHQTNYFKIPKLINHLLGLYPNVLLSELDQMCIHMKCKSTQHDTNLLNILNS